MKRNRRATAGMLGVGERSQILAATSYQLDALRKTDQNATLI